MLLFLAVHHEGIERTWHPGNVCCLLLFVDANGPCGFVRREQWQEGLREREEIR